MCWQKRPFLADIQVAAVCQTAATKEISQTCVGFIVLCGLTLPWICTGVSLRRAVASLRYVRRSMCPYAVTEVPFPQAIHLARGRKRLPSWLEAACGQPLEWTACLLKKFLSNNKLGVCA